MNNNEQPMESNVAVNCSHIVKDYVLYSTFGEKIKGLLFSTNKTKVFRALDDVDLQLYKGECLGLIGMNGSGKSTLASIITGITAPTKGNIDIKGEVSMLGANSGMRPLLSGIDNIRFKCLLLGFSETKIKELEKDIIEFADIGIHIDQPVKTYSSGMRSRLGFAISAHIDPDVLIIDEALSVGDSSFTDKCLAKIDEFKKQEKTIVFVTHSVTQLSGFCNRVMWLNKGKIVGIESPESIIMPYCGFAREFAAMTNEERAAFQPDLKEYQEKYI